MDPLLLPLTLIQLALIGAVALLYRMHNVLKEIEDHADLIRSSLESMHGNVHHIAQPFIRAQDAELEQLIQDQLQDEAKRKALWKLMGEQLVKFLKARRRP